MRVVANHRSFAPSAVILWVAMMMLATSPTLRADGGAVVLHRETGRYIVTVFASPAPLRAGPVDLSVLIQQRETLDAVLDASVVIEIGKNASRTSVQASHALAQNKLLFAASVDLAEPGEWNYSVTIRHSDNADVVSGVLTAGEAAPALMTYWPYLAVPPVFILLFGIHQWLLRQRAVRRSENGNGRETGSKRERTPAVPIAGLD